MRTNLLLLLAVTSTCFSAPLPQLQQEKFIISNDNSAMTELFSLLSPQIANARTPAIGMDEIRNMLQLEAPTLNSAVIDKVLKTLKCANEYNVERNNILTVIDYSLPSSEKRLWVFDLKEKKLLFHTYVSHGIKSGTLLTKFFSNKYNSKSSSIGVYKTEKSYYGRDGLSLRLDGLDPGFNDNAAIRAVVMHGGWYVDEGFIKKYGRAGRSWGCPALPLNQTSGIINTIKDDSLFVVYYPSDNWFMRSKFLNCDNLSPTRFASNLDTEIKPTPNEVEQREDVIFAKVFSKNIDNEPIVAMLADDYTRIFHTSAPLDRMLRRQINNREYIALSKTEFESIISNNNKDEINAINFVIPVIKMVRGYYATEMHLVDFGKIKEIKLNPGTSSGQGYTVNFEFKPSITLKTTDQFIRWVGL